MFLNRNSSTYIKYLIEFCETLHFIILIILTDYKNVNIANMLNATLY